MVNKLFLTTLDKCGEEIGLELTVYDIFVMIDQLWTRRRNRMLGARLIDYISEMGTDIEKELVEEKNIDMKKVKKKVKEYDKVRGLIK
jgi:hypothetical protein